MGLLFMRFSMMLPCYSFSGCLCPPNEGSLKTFANLVADETLAARRQLSNQ